MRKVDRPPALLQTGAEELAAKVTERSLSGAVTALRTRLEQLCPPVRAKTGIVGVHKLRGDARPAQREQTMLEANECVSVTPTSGASPYRY